MKRTIDCVSLGYSDDDGDDGLTFLDLPHEMLSLVIGFAPGDAQALAATCRALEHVVRRVVVLRFSTAVQEARALVAAWGGATPGDVRRFVSPLADVCHVHTPRRTSLPLSWVFTQASACSVLPDVTEQMTRLVGLSNPTQLIKELDGWSRTAPVDAVLWGMFMTNELRAFPVHSDAQRPWRSATLRAFPVHSDAQRPWRSATLNVVARMYARLAPTAAPIRWHNKNTVKALFFYWMYSSANTSIGLTMGTLYHYDPALPLIRDAMVHPTTAGFLAHLSTMSSHAVPAPLLAVPIPPNAPPTRPWPTCMLPLSQFGTSFLELFIKHRIYPGHVYIPMDGLSLEDAAIRKSFFEAMCQLSLAPDWNFYRLAVLYLTGRLPDWRTGSVPGMNIVSALACVIDAHAGDDVWLTLFNYMRYKNPMLLVRAKDECVLYLDVTPIGNRRQYVITRLLRDEIDLQFAAALLLDTKAWNGLGQYRHHASAEEVLACMIRLFSLMSKTTDSGRLVYLVRTLVSSYRDGPLALFLAAFALPVARDDWQQFENVVCAVYYSAASLPLTQRSYFYSDGDAMANRLPLFRGLANGVSLREAKMRRSLATFLHMSQCTLLEYTSRQEALRCAATDAPVIAVSDPDAPSGMQLRAVVRLTTGTLIADAWPKYAARGPADTANVAVSGIGPNARLVTTRDVEIGQELVVSVEQGR